MVDLCKIDVGFAAVDMVAEDQVGDGRPGNGNDGVDMAAKRTKSNLSYFSAFPFLLLCRTFAQ